MVARNRPKLLLTIISVCLSVSLVPVLVQNEGSKIKNSTIDHVLQHLHRCGYILSTCLHIWIHVAHICTHSIKFVNICTTIGQMLTAFGNMLGTFGGNLVTTFSHMLATPLFNSFKPISHVNAFDS